MLKKQFFTTGLMIVSFMVIFFPARVSLGQEIGENKIALESETARETPTVEEAVSPEDTEAKGMTLFELIKKGGIVGYTIILLSFIALGLVIDYTFSIRLSKFAPPRDVATIRKLIKDHKIEEIKKLDQERSSFLSQVVIAGLNEVHSGYQTMIKAMEDASEALNAKIVRKVEHLNVISNISPMLGLLGTVTGMLRCFNEIAQIKGTVEPQQLAHGIFEALVTTVEGLVVAIPALYLFAIFRNRADEFTGETSLIAEELVTSFKPDNKRE